MLAEQYSAPRLATAAARECRDHLETIVENGSVGALSSSCMTELLAHQELRASSAVEEAVFKALEAWWRAQSPAPDTEALARLVKLVRFPLMATEFVRGYVRESSLMHGLHDASPR